MQREIILNNRNEGAPGTEVREPSTIYLGHFSRPYNLKAYYNTLTNASKDTDNELNAQFQLH